MNIPEEMLANVAYIVHCTANDYESHFDREMKALKLTRSQWVLLAHLNFCNGINQKDLADIMSIGKGAIGKLARKLEKSGWLLRRPDAEDGRAFNLHITRKAKPIVNKLCDLLMMETERSLLGFTADEVTFLQNALGRIRKTIADVPPSPEWVALKKAVLADVKRAQLDRR